MSTSVKLVAPLALLGALFIASPGTTQWPPEPKNLQVLPEEIDTQELIGIMRGFTSALGVRCQFCHIGEEGQPLAEFDFASDAKSHKRKARTMLQMTRAINQDWIPKLDEDGDSDSDSDADSDSDSDSDSSETGHHGEATAAGAQMAEASHSDVDSDADSDSDSDSDGHAEPIQVSCATCHRGQKYPELIDDLLAKTVRNEGVETAVARYRELREKFYGGHSYDFTARPLDSLGEQIAVGGDLETGLALIELNLEYHPDNAWGHHLRGEILLRQEDREGALDAFRRSLELDPDNLRAQQRIEELTKPESGETGEDASSDG